MKEIKASIQPHMLGRVMQALHALPHFPGVTILDAAGQGRGRGAGGAYRVTEEEIFFHQRKRIEVVCADELAATIVEAIQKSAHTGHPGDGLIVVTNIHEAVRIRTGEQGHAAV
jgi:nitrogen regulatory protein P-II 1